MFVRPADVKKVLNQIKSPSPTVKASALETLALLLTTNTRLDGFPVTDLGREFVKILQKDKNPEVLERDSQCILNFLIVQEELGARLILRNNFLAVVSEHIDRFPPLAIENCIHAVSVITKSRALEVAQHFDVKTIIDQLPQFRLAEQRFAIQAVDRMTACYFEKQSIKSLPSIAGLLASSDQTIATTAMKSFRNILEHIELTDLPVAAVENLALATSCIRDSFLQRQVLDALINATAVPSLAEAIINTGVSFDVMLMGCKYSAESDRVLRLSLELIKQLLPPADLPFDIWDDSLDRDFPSNSAVLAKAVQPTLMRIVSEKCQFMELAICDLAMALKVQSDPLPLEITAMKSLVMLCQSPNLAPFALLVFENAKDDVSYVTDVLSTLANVKFPPGTPISAWYEERIGKMKEGVEGEVEKPKLPMAGIFLDFPTLVEFVNNNDFSTAEFLSAGYCEVALELINKCRNFQCVKMEKLRDTLLQLLSRSLIPTIVESCASQSHSQSIIPTIVDPCRSMTSADFANAKLTVDIRCDGRTHTRKVFESSALMVSVEAWYNEKIGKMKRQNIKKAMKNKGDLSRVISSDFRVQDVSYAQIGIYSRIFKAHNYRQFSFRMDGKVFGPLDSLFEAMARTLPSPDLWNAIVPTIELLPEDDSLQVPEMIVPKTNIPNCGILDLLAKMKEVQPDMDMSCPDYEKLLRPYLSSFFLDIGLYSPAVQVAANYPFLFSQEFRVFIFRLICGDFFSSLSLAHHAIFESPDKLVDGRIVAPCIVARDRLFEDGVLLMETLGDAPVILEMRFENEAGFGIGPSREFLSEFGQELCKKERNLWRTELTDSEYAVGPNGLFPSPTADPEMFYILGVLCAKAVSINVVLPIPLSKEFFQLVKNEPVAIEKVDPVLARSLNENRQQLFGLPFVYPGYGEPELEPGGADMTVNRQNVHRYVTLVKDFTCGKRLRPLCERFMAGFSSGFQNSYWNMLTADDFRLLIIGDEMPISMQDLKKFADVCNGYTVNSPQISMLYEVICEMTPEEQSLFIQFCTGSSRLPIGGLENLHPPLTISRRLDQDMPSDSALPSSLTCVNLFKLPPYSTKEIMRTKILTAITDGQGIFLLT